MRYAAVCQQLTESVKNEEISFMLFLCTVVLQLRTHLVILDLCIQCFKKASVFNTCILMHVLPVTETVWVVSFGSGPWSMMEESGVSVKGD